MTILSTLPSLISLTSSEKTGVAPGILLLLKTAQTSTTRHRIIAHSTIFLTLELIDFSRPPAYFAEFPAARSSPVYLLRRDVSVERFIPVRLHFGNSQHRTGLPLGGMVGRRTELAGPQDFVPAHKHRPITAMP